MDWRSVAADEKPRMRDNVAAGLAAEDRLFEVPTYLDPSAVVVYLRVRHHNGHWGLYGGTFRRHDYSARDSLSCGARYYFGADLDALASR